MLAASSRQLLQRLGRSTTAVRRLSRSTASSTASNSSLSCPTQQDTAMDCCSGNTCTGHNRHKDGLQQLLMSNRQWAAEVREKDPDFFNRLVNQQNPEYLWIGCSDSRVPANQILGLAPGEIFVQRNVGNQAMHTDMNLMSCLEYAVKSLKVKTIILCGHYNCGAVRAALQLPTCTPGLVNCWISDIRECRNRAEQELIDLDPEQQLARLCELNVLRQVFHVATSPIVSSAWAEGQELHLYGLIYDVADGHLRKLAGPISSDDGYVKNVQEFVARGLQVTRCPTTQRLRVSKPDEYLPSAAAAAAAAGMLVSPRGAGGRGNNSSSNGGGGGNECGHIASNGGGVVGEHGEDDSVFVTPPSFSFGSSPSEIMSGINSINLAESIARHNQWAATAAAAASAITATATPADKAAAAAAATAAVAASGGGGVVRAQADSDGEEAAA